MGKFDRDLYNKTGIYCNNFDAEDLKNEIWKDCEGYDGIYSVSNLGRIRSEQREVKCNRGSYLKPIRILKQQIVASNPHNIRFISKALKVTFHVGGEKKTFSVSTLVGLAFIGDKGRNQCYSKQNKLWYDCRAINLKLGSISESTTLAYSKGFLNRYKKTLTYNHKAVNIFKRLSDNKEFKGGVGIKAEYGYDCSRLMKNSIKTGKKTKGSYWEIIPIN